jgi:thiol-disulfide isomerase/thioredoxin
VTRHRGTGTRRVATGVLLLGLLTGCGGTSSDTPGYISGDGVIEQVAAHERKAVPRISGRLLDGGTFDSDDYAGRVVVYNVWGSWCPPCREEAPDLQRVWHETKAYGGQFVGIDVKDNDAAARAFEREYGVTYPSINGDDSATALLAFSGSLPANAVPSTVIVDRQGRLAARVVGKTTYATLRALVRDVLAEGGAQPGKTTGQ